MLDVRIQNTQHYKYICNTLNKVKSKLSFLNESEILCSLSSWCIHFISKVQKKVQTQNIFIHDAYLDVLLYEVQLSKYLERDIIEAIGAGNDFNFSNNNSPEFFYLLEKVLALSLSRQENESLSVDITLALLDQSPFHYKVFTETLVEQCRIPETKEKCSDMFFSSISFQSEFAHHKYSHEEDDNFHFCQIWQLGNVQSYTNNNFTKLSILSEIDTITWLRAIEGLPSYEHKHSTFFHTYLTGDSDAIIDLIKIIPSSHDEYNWNRNACPILAIELALLFFNDIKNSVANEQDLDSNEFYRWFEKFFQIFINREDGPLLILAYLGHILKNNHEYNHHNSEIQNHLVLALVTSLARQEGDINRIYNTLVTKKTDCQFYFFSAALLTLKKKQTHLDQKTVVEWLSKLLSENPNSYKPFETPWKSKSYQIVSSTLAGFKNFDQIWILGWTQLENERHLMSQIGITDAVESWIWIGLLMITEAVNIEKTKRSSLNFLWKHIYNALKESLLYTPLRIKWRSKPFSHSFAYLIVSWTKMHNTPKALHKLQEVLLFIQNEIDIFEEASYQLKHNGIDINNLIKNNDTLTKK